MRPRATRAAARSRGVSQAGCLLPGRELWGRCSFSRLLGDKVDTTGVQSVVSSELTQHGRTTGSASKCNTGIGDTPLAGEPTTDGPLTGELTADGPQDKEPPDEGPLGEPMAEGPRDGEPTAGERLGGRPRGATALGASGRGVDVHDEPGAGGKLGDGWWLGGRTVTTCPIGARPPGRAPLCMGEAVPLQPLLQLVQLLRRLLAPEATSSLPMLTCSVGGATVGPPVLQPLLRLLPWHECWNSRPSTLARASRTLDEREGAGTWSYSSLPSASNVLL